MAQTLAFEALPDDDQKVLDELATAAGGASPMETAPGVDASPLSEGGAPRQAEARRGRRSELSSTIAFGAEEIEQARQFALDAEVQETESAQAAAQAAAQRARAGSAPPGGGGGPRTLAFEMPPEVHDQAPNTPPMGALASHGKDRVDATSTRGGDTQGGPDVPHARRKKSSHHQTIAFSSEEVVRERPLAQTVAFGLDALEADVPSPSEPPPKAEDAAAPGPRQGGGKGGLASTIAFSSDERGQFEPAAAQDKSDLATTMAFDAEGVGFHEEQIVDESSKIEVPAGRTARSRTMIGGVAAPGTAEPPTSGPAGTMMGMGRPVEVAEHARAQMGLPPRGGSEPDHAAAPQPRPTAPQAGLQHPGASPQRQAPMAVPPAATHVSPGQTTTPPPARGQGTKLLAIVVVLSVVTGVAIALGLRFAGVF